MTMPHLMNCPHSEDGWCLDCVKELWERTEGATDMTWTPEALKIVRELETNCRDFIYLACEYAANAIGAPEVTPEHVATVLAWLASTAVDLEG